MFLPAGSQDEIGNKLDNRAKAYEIFREVVRSRNYKAISTPVVEYANTFINEHVGMKLHAMLKWFNREGEIEVLRADWTTAIARALVNQHPGQLKWSYQGSVFRNDKDGTESRQAGIEIIRTEPFLGESESLFTAVTYLNELGIEDYLIELGHTGIFEELTAPLNLERTEEEQLRQAMHDKRRDVVEEIATAKGHPIVAKRLTQVIDAYGTLDEIEKYQTLWADNPRLKAILDHLGQLVNVLQGLGIQEVLVDLGRVKNLPYYCGTMFRGYLKQNGATCFSGGRYDKLYEQFNEKISAVGLAFDVDVLANQLDTVDKKETVCIIASVETHVFAERLRTSYPDSIVDIQYTLPEQHDYDKIVKIVIDNNNEFRVIEE
ncbi:ATP phosphoribosyltransferase regulatory subunit [Paraliobacillus quinghaiensis]|uniref:ATP phosphoribosyltransferase regulatory subunit n=1 Tax=Paraliobacillus quinghaiensis TaxID=470815 RepID=A0A917TTR2_9BACI|nr:ATP phosphoribosyltransferase regulatory subunit [Paraliobacillus quinghaiensis]GGM37760.1 ATP phosphoribosyltransferase regulatory subunit [Paraliobacillus quinghaiensis]